jgi:hypothetical protein
MGGAGRRPSSARWRTLAGEVVASAGAAGHRELRDRLIAGGPAAAVGLLEELADPSPGRPRDGGGHPSDIMADLEETVTAVARAHPAAFVATVARIPALLDRFDVLCGLGRVPGPESSEWLLEALGASSGFHRRIALHALVDRGEPRAIAQLRRRLRDRDSGVRGVAADGLRRWGGPEDIDELIRYGERAGYGGLECARDAVESICERAGGPLPQGHPGKRLVSVEVGAGAGAELVHGVMVALGVRRGDRLASGGGGEVIAPCDGSIAAIDRDGDGRLLRIVLRRA